MLNNQLENLRILVDIYAELGKNKGKSKDQDFHLKQHLPRYSSLTVHFMDEFL